MCAILFTLLSKSAILFTPACRNYNSLRHWLIPRFLCTFFSVNVQTKKVALLYIINYTVFLVLMQSSLSPKRVIFIGLAISQLKLFLCMCSFSTLYPQELTQTRKLRMKHCMSQLVDTYLPYAYKCWIKEPLEMLKKCNFFSIGRSVTSEVQSLKTPKKCFFDKFL